jgi:hypothetical protein
MNKEQTLKAENSLYPKRGSAGAAHIIDATMANAVATTVITPLRMIVMKANESTRAATERYAEFNIAATKSSKRKMVSEKLTKIGDPGT